jgi:ribosomal protein S18 acetylase RimI-like enzyme
MKSKLTFVDAEIKDSKLLSSIAFNSKKNWGYSNGLMNLWKEDLEITEDYIRENKTVKAFDGKTFLGFFAIKNIDIQNAELDHLWLKPENIKKNYGREIFSHIIEYLSSNGIEKMTLIAEPNAIGFYQKMNGSPVGKFQSKISGRVLDIYEFKIK